MKKISKQKSYIPFFLVPKMRKRHVLPIYAVYPVCPTWADGIQPYHPQTQGKIEQWHCSLKNQILLENYYLPGELEDRIRRFVDYYNHERYHESLNNLTPVDVSYGRGQAILDKRESIKLRTLAIRRQMYYDKQSKNLNLMSCGVS